MYKKVVIPLDGSKLAEQALWYLEKIAQDKPEVMLVSVTKRLSGVAPEREVFEPYVSEHEVKVPPPQFILWPTGVAPYTTDVDTNVDLGTHNVPLSVGKMEATARKYLSRVAEHVEAKGFRVKIEVLMGDPAKEIARYAKEENVDLIIIASIGKHGLNRWDMSNIAEGVIKESRVPVTVINPGPGFKETKPKRKGVSS